ncbi:hypothetical protein KA977_04845 [Candidatus Dependentiae bacterium]|nr:hypothetical protein [Candidatus Dependentiae bacterium]
MINQRIKLYLYLFLSVLSILVNFAGYYYISIYNRNILNLFFIISPLITIFVFFVGTNYIFEKILKNKFQIFSDDYFQNYSLKKTESIKILKTETIDQLMSQIFSDIKRIKLENIDANEKLKKFIVLSNEFSSELESFKISSITDLKNGQTNCGYILKKTGEISDFLFESETILKSIKINFTNSIGKIDGNLKNKTKLTEHLNKLILITKDFDKIFENIQEFGSDFKSKEETVISKITNMINNVERQSINILNAYIFSNQENQSATVSDHSSEFEREENLQNIKNMNESIKNEIMQIKNSLLVLFELTKIFKTEFDKNADVFKQLNGYLAQIPQYISNFFETDDLIKNILQRDSLQLTKMFDKLNNETENVKNINLKLNNLSKSIDDFNSEIIKLNFGVTEES